MKAQFIFENYPPGVEYDSNAPWNDSDSSWTEFDMDNTMGGIYLKTKVQVSEEDEEEIEKESIDPMILDKALLKKLGLNYEELESMGIEEEFRIDDYRQKGDIVLFKTTAGDTKLYIGELSQLAEETQKLRKYKN